MRNMTTKPRQCRRCHGPLTAERVEHPYWNGITLVAIVQNVPSWVCQLCGYQHFDHVVEMTLGDTVKDYVDMGTLFPIPRTQYRDTSSSSPAAVGRGTIKLTSATRGSPASIRRG